MSNYADLIEKYGRQYNIDPKWIGAIMQTESNGNPDAISPKGAIGLMQMLPETARSLGIDPKNPEQSIEGAARLLNENLNRYGTPELATLAYHGGTNQDNWGPKTQDYLRKVSANYGAPPVASASAVPDDFVARFGPRPTAGTTQAAPADDAASAFSARFGERPVTAEAKTASEPAKSATPAPIPASTTPETASGGIGDMAWRGLQALGEQGLSNVNVVGRGISDALDAPSEWLASGAEESGLTGLLGKAGINMPTAEQQKQINAQSRGDFAARNPDGGIQQEVGRALGNVLGVGGPLAAGEAALVKGGQALSGALGNPAALNAAGSFLRGQGGLASRVGYNAAQGGAAGALLSGGQPGVSTGESAATGAVLGGAIPIAGGLIRGGVNAAKGVFAPFSAEGRDTLAKQFIQNDAAKVAPKMAGAPDEIPIASSSAKPDVIPAADPASGALSRFSMNGPIKGDFAEYVPGSTPTLAQATGNAGLAQLERTMFNRDVNSFTARQEANTTARQDYLSQIRGTPETIQAAQDLREQQAIPLLKQAFEGAGKADSSPVLSTIKGILASPDGKRGVVQDALNPIISKLQIGQQFQRDPLIPGSKIPMGVNGNGLEYDVGQLYGIRKSINDQLEKVSGKDNSVATLASSDLIKVKEAIDGVIEKAAPGFKDYLAQYAELSKPVSAQSYLQKIDLTGADSQALSLNKVKQLMLRVNKDRAASGSNDAKAISEDQMQMLSNLHKDLQREANSAKGKGIGSNTAQNLEAGKLVDSMLVPGSGTFGQVSSAGVGGLLGHALAGPVGAVPGSIIAQQAAQRFNQSVAAQAPDVEARLIDYLLNSKGADVLNRARSSTPAMDALLRRAPVAAPAASSAFSGGNQN